MKNKTKIIISVIGIVVSTALLIISSVLAEEKLISTEMAITFTAVSVVLVLIAVSYSVKVDYETGVYECKNCEHTFKPSFKKYIFASHTPKTRHLRCPKCGEKSWCRRKNS